MKPTDKNTEIFNSERDEHRTQDYLGFKKNSTWV